MIGINDTRTIFGNGAVRGTDAGGVDAASSNAASVSQPADVSSAEQPAAGQVNVSFAAGALALGGTDVERMDKVAKLQSTIDSGSYNVPSSDVADKLIDSMLGE